jgi:hypothetical protein
MFRHRPLSPNSQDLAKKIRPISASNDTTKMPSGRRASQLRKVGLAHRQRKLPDVPKFRRLWSELPAMVKDRLKLSALLVSEDGTVLEIT